MATLRKRGTKWQVQIRREGRNLSKTFHFREDAARWAREQERSIDRGEASLPPVNRVTGLKLAELIDRYRQEILPTKRTGGVNERFHLRAILRHPIAGVGVSQLSEASIAAFRDHRLTQVSGSTVRRELGLLMHALKIARVEWRLPVPELKPITKPPANNPRERRLAEEELGALDDALHQCRNKVVRPAFLFALATGMRRGEVLSLTWDNVDLAARTAFLPITKNGRPRFVPLSPHALTVLLRLPRRRKMSCSQSRRTA